ncbi:circadian clock-controlled protein daywake-like [Choristoneura fumiferana]
MFVRYSLVALIALLHFASPGAVPFTKCKAEDSKCIKDNTQVLVPLFAAGIPELGVESMDPIFFKEIDASSDTLKLKFSDITLKGLKGCRFKKISRDAAKSVISAKIHCDVVLDGQYDMDGRVLILPIQGKGKVHIEHEKIEISFDLNYKEETGADGKKHWITGKWKHSFAYKGKTIMEFDNLFNGNEVLGRAARELIKTSANEIASETAGPILKVIVARIIKNLKAFFEHIPVEEFALD